MIATHAAPPFPVHLVFPDIDPDILAREDADAADPREGCWSDYLRRVLPAAPRRADAE